jgi:hypothetical protein
MEISHSAFIGNSVSGDNGANGGALANAFFGPSAIVEHSTFVGNSANGASAQGGALFNGVLFGAAGTLTVHHSAIVGNHVTGASALGGGIHNAEGASSTLTHSLVFANRATTDGGEAIGGGIYNAGTLFVDKANIKFNKATTSDDNVSGDLTPLDEAFADPTLL